MNRTLPEHHFQQQPTRTLRAGFTLFEMLVVISLIAVAMAVTWPAMQRLSKRQQLNQAAELARIRLLTARVFAVQRDVPYQFRFEPGGQRFCVLHGDSATEPELPAGGGTVKLPIAAGKLPGAVKFDQLEIGTLGGGMIPETRFSALPDAHDLAIVNWSPPIVFQPDGSAEDQKITISDPDSGTTFELALRGLTGGVLITRRAD